MAATQTSSSTETTAEYRGGQAAFSLGVTECPFKGKLLKETTADLAKRRTDWWDGWLDAESDKELGPLFDRNNLGRMSRC
jgi:hypothetical protein